MGAQAPLGGQILKIGEPTTGSALGAGNLRQGVLPSTGYNQGLTTGL